MAKAEEQFAYTVRGHWPFPLDMLRHDMSAAATPEDQAKIDLLSADHAADISAFEDIDINLVGHRRPNGARWESFGWQLPFDEEWQRIKRWKAKERERLSLRKTGLAKLTAAERRALEIKDEA